MPLWLKIRNQRVDTGGLCGGGGAYAWSNTSVKEKVGLSAEGPIRGGGVGGGGRGEEIRYNSQSHPTKKNPTLISLKDILILIFLAINVFLSFLQMNFSNFYRHTEKKCPAWSPQCSF